MYTPGPSQWVAVQLLLHHPIIWRHLKVFRQVDTVKKTEIQTVHHS